MHMPMSNNSLPRCSLITVITCNMVKMRPKGLEVQKRTRDSCIQRMVDLSPRSGYSQGFVKQQVKGHIFPILMRQAR